MWYINVVHFLESWKLPQSAAMPFCGSLLFYALCNSKSFRKCCWRGHSCDTVYINDFQDFCSPKSIHIDLDANMCRFLTTITLGVVAGWKRNCGLNIHIVAHISSHYVIKPFWMKIIREHLKVKQSFKFFFQSRPTLIHYWHIFER